MKSKDLLRITHVKDDICEIRIGLDTEEKAMMLSDILLGVMVKSPRLARAVIAAASMYVKARSSREEPKPNDKKVS